MAKCSICGKNIKNIYYLNGKVYGYECYKRELSLLYKKFEDEKNAEYSAKCFAAMQIFKNKKSNRFHDSVCEQYESCKKITAKQLECIIKSFTNKEMIDFCQVWFYLSKKDNVKRDIAYILYENVKVNREFFIRDENIINNEDIIDILTHTTEFQHGLFFYKDTFNKIFIEKTGSERSKRSTLKSYQDEDIEILKIVYK